jgi:hypothetical protein
VITQSHNRVSKLLLLIPLFSSLIFPVELEILSLGSVRLEVRRLSGHIRNDQVYWREGDDDDYGMCVFDPDGIEVIDDAALGKHPYIIFEFKFREDPEIAKLTQRKEEGEDTKVGIRITRKSTKGDTSGLPAIGKAEGMSFM